MSGKLNGGMENRYEHVFHLLGNNFIRFFKQKKRKASILKVETEGP